MSGNSIVKVIVAILVAFLVWKGICFMMYLDYSQEVRGQMQSQWIENQQHFDEINQQLEQQK